MMRPTNRRVLCYVLISVIVAGFLYISVFNDSYDEDWNSLLKVTRNLLKWKYFQEVYSISHDEGADDSPINPGNQRLPKIPNHDVSKTKMIPTSKTTSNRTTCKPRNNIVFLKMHKCSSSTVQNILFRYGQTHELNFVLPHQGNFLGAGYPTFNKKSILKLPVKEYNIFCFHTRFNEQNIAELMPTDSRYVTILRDPVTMFESIFTYYKYDKIYRINGSTSIKRLYKFLKSPRQFYMSDRGKEYMGHSKAPMLYDLGLENRLKDNQGYIDGMINNISKRFDLVMMTEYFHESLILLKELMCWTLNDIVFLPLNARTKSTVPSSITPANQKRIRQWNGGDVKLYHHFNRTFWQKVQDFGEERMRQEVKLLKERNTYYRELCIEAVRNDSKDVYHPPHISIDTFQIRSEMKDDYQCTSMTTPELNFTGDIRATMIQRYIHIDIRPIST